MWYEIALETVINIKRNELNNRIYSISVDYNARINVLDC